MTDHKPLMTILGPKKGIPTLAAAPLQRWAWILSAYRYDIPQLSIVMLMAYLAYPSWLEEACSDSTVFNIPVNVTKLRVATTADRYKKFKNIKNVKG